MKSLKQTILEATYHEYGTREYFSDNYENKYGPSKYRKGMRTIRIPTGNKLRPVADVDVGCCKLNGFLIAKTKYFNFDKRLEGKWYEVSFMNKGKNKNIIAFITDSSPWIIFYEKYLKSYKLVNTNHETQEDEYEAIDNSSDFNDTSEHITNWTWSNFKAVYVEDFEYDDPNNLYRILSNKFDDICKNNEVIEDIDDDNI